MDILQYFQNQNLRLDAVVIMLVLAAGFFQKRYLFHIKITEAWRTMLTGFVFTTIYVGLQIIAREFKYTSLIDYFVSFAVATSFYDLILKPVIKSLFPNRKTEPNEAGQE